MKPLVIVTWDDAEDPKGGWLDEDEVDKFSKKETLVKSVGFLVSNTEKYVTLAADWIDDLKHYGRVTKISKPQVISIEDLTCPSSSLGSS